MANEDVDKLSMSQRWTLEVAGKGFVPGESISGGEPQRDEVDGTTGDSLQAEATSGQESVGSITVTSYVFPTCKVWRDIYMATMVNKVKDHRFDMTVQYKDEQGNVTETKDYHDCVLTMYDFPLVQAGSGELLKETVEIRPLRCVVKG